MSCGYRILDIDGRTVPYLRLSDWVDLANALHVRALAAPVASTADGLPVGAQLIGRWGEEDRLLDLADALEHENRSRMADLSTPSIPP